MAPVPKIQNILIRIILLISPARSDWTYLPTNTLKPDTVRANLEYMVVMVTQFKKKIDDDGD